MISVSPFARRIIMNPPPPMFPAGGQVTASASPTPTAASMALPPRCMISTPTRDAISLVEATIPCRARAGSRDAACGVIAIEMMNRKIRTIAKICFFILPSELDQMRKNLCESVKSVSSVAYEFERISLLVPHRPRITLIRRICVDTAPSLAICLLQAISLNPTARLSIHPYIPHNQLLSNEQCYYCGRSKKDSKRDLHSHTTTAKQDQQHADQ